MRRISLVWLVCFALFFIALAGLRADAWVAGLLAVAVGGLVHTGLGGRQGALIRPTGVLRFVPFFVAQAVRGGVDVARRAFSPSLPLSPGFVGYRIRLPEGSARIVFVNCISLLPGTFSARLADRELLVHVLARDDELATRLARLEERVAGLFGLTLTDDEGGSEGGPVVEAAQALAEERPAHG